MIPSIPQPAYARRLYTAYVVAFFVYLFAPLLVVGVLAFNDSLFPALPWQGFTLDWFLSRGPRRVGLFHDQGLLRGMATSAQVALWVAGLSVVVGTCSAFLFEQEEFPFKQALYALALTPLVIPGVILGISILLFSSTVAGTVERWSGVEVEALRPGLTLVVLGQFSFITTLATLIIVVGAVATRYIAEDSVPADVAESALQRGFFGILAYLLPFLFAAGAISEEVESRTF
ncbi:MAG: ABC transporter permease, partial [candidate division NC10 bacterium]